MDFTNNDPLLRPTPYNIPDLEKEQEAMQRKIAELKRDGFHRTQPQAPTWDEIDRIMSSLSDKETRYLQTNQEFVESSNAVMAVLQREYMRIMRPVVEQTKDGKDALDKHLTLLRRLVKTAKDEADKKNSLIDEYMTKYGHLTWQEFVKMKKGE